MRLNRFDEHLELHRLDCLSSHRNLENYEFMRRFLAQTPPEEVRPARLLTGDDLIGLGFRPGPGFKEILDAAEDAQLRWKDQHAGRGTCSWVRQQADALGKVGRK